MASPHVAGTVALMLANGINVDNVRSVLADTAEDLGAFGRDSFYGWGLVNAAAAVGVPDSESTIVNVESITYGTAGGKNRKQDLLITVALVDNLGGPVANASVSIVTYLDGSIYATGDQGITGMDGRMIFTLPNAPRGTYVTEVDDVTAEGLTWDSITPENSFRKK
jgi:hypothetical protein